ncbi:MAG: UDP-N-acetylglucosamine 2-epimerase [Alphaproteobacteria bacterium]
MRKIKRICVVIGSRANYSSIKSLLVELKKDDFFQLQIVVGFSALIENYGKVSDLIERDGFKIDSYIYAHLDGDHNTMMAKTTGLGIIELSSAFEKLKPDLVFTIGDRFETLATAISAAYMNIPLAHTMGGEVSGNLDESVRHAITKLAHIHFPASKESYDRIIRLGEDRKYVCLSGCPRIDLIKLISDKNEFNPGKESITAGVGDNIDIDKEFSIVLYHPVTSENDETYNQMNIILECLIEFDFQSIILWPNADFGTNKIAKSIRKFREREKMRGIRFFKNFKFEDYIKLLNITKCLIGNSSSGIRDCGFIGTPVVNIGSRQNSRERSKNVFNVKFEKKEIINAIIKQSKREKFKPSNIYGDGKAAIKIINFLKNLSSIPIQKKIVF